MNRRLREDDIAPALLAFARGCASQFKEFGFQISDIEGVFQLQLTDDPILEHDHSHRWHGRTRYKGTKYANAYWACADDPGVYLFFDSSGNACYVGKAEVALGFRLGAHVGARGSDRMYSSSAFPEAEYVIVVPFREAPWLAPAFESYLLRQFKFPRNQNLGGQQESTPTP